MSICGASLPLRTDDPGARLCSESTIRALEQAMVEAQKHVSRSDALAALAVVGQDLLE